MNEDMNFQQNPDPFDKTRQIPAFHAMEVSNVIQEYLEDLLQNKIEPTEFALNKNFQGPFWVIHSLSWLVKQNWWKYFFEKKLYEVFKDRNHDLLGLMAVYESIFFDSYVSTSDGRTKIIDLFLKYQDPMSVHIYSDWSNKSIFSAFELIKYNSAMLMELRDLKTNKVYEVINTTVQNFSVGQTLIIRIVPRLDKYIFTGGFSLIREVLNVKKNKIPHNIKEFASGIDLAQIIGEAKIDQFAVTKIFFNNQSDRSYKIDYPFAMKRVSYNLRKENSKFNLQSVLTKISSLPKNLNNELSNIFENKKDSIVQTLAENSSTELNNKKKTFELDPITLDFKKVNSKLVNAKKYKIDFVNESLDLASKAVKANNYALAIKYLSNSSEITESNNKEAIMKWIKIFGEVLYYFGELDSLNKIMGSYTKRFNFPEIDIVGALNEHEKIELITIGNIRKFEKLNLTDFEVADMVLHYTFDLHSLLLDLGCGKVAFTKLGKIRKSIQNEKYLEKSKYDKQSIEFLYSYLSDIDLLTLENDNIILTDLGLHFVYQRPEFDLLSWVLGNINIYSKFDENECKILGILIFHMNKFGSAKWDIDTVNQLFETLNLKIDNTITIEILKILQTLKIIGLDSESKIFTTDLGVKFSEYVLMKMKSFIPFNLLKAIEI